MQDITTIKPINPIHSPQRTPVSRTLQAHQWRETPLQLNARPPKEAGLGEKTSEANAEANADAPPSAGTASRPRVVASHWSFTPESGLQGYKAPHPRRTRTELPNHLMSDFKLPSRPATELIADMLAKLGRQGSKAIIDFLLEHWETLPTMRSFEGRPVLAELVLAGQHEAVEFVLGSKNADQHLRAQSSSGANALMYAAQEGMVCMVQSLLSVSPALAREQLQHRVEGNNALMVAAADGQVDVVNILLQDHALAALQLACRSATGESALMYAAANGHVDTVRALLGSIWALAEGGRDLRQIHSQTGARNALGERALELACKHGEREIAELIAPLTPAAMPNLMPDLKTIAGQADWRRRPW